MSSAVKRKQTNVSIEKKLEAVKKLNKGESVSKVAMEFGVGESTIGDWKKKSLEIESWCVKRVCSDTLSDRKSMEESE